ncbi:hypothetical protein ASZ78_003957 [Callipepla squamata]|uniref:EGF-like domain-containing protein n=1 Tax=Callipepla squamata TaxID=9009 RepID=A0A226MMX0_CALSU|nr:hypothetical protein ASZ78_003957 [Callipepla squamata]
MSALRGWGWLLAALLSLTPRAGPAGATPQRRLPWASWPEGRALSEVTHPSRLVRHSTGGEVLKHQLDTKVRNESGAGGGPGVHLARVSFVVRAFGSAFVLDLELNHSAPRAQLCAVPQGAGEHCYYQGRVRGRPRSFAALSSCQGLHGVFSDGRDIFLIEPQAGAEHGEGLQPHLIQRTPSCAQPGCMLGAVGQSASGSSTRLRRRRRQVRRSQHTVHSETKYIELAVVNDHQLVGTWGRGTAMGQPPTPCSPKFLQLRRSVVLTSNFAKSVVNLADIVSMGPPMGWGLWIYKEQLNTRIVLVAMETWAAGDRIRMEDDSMGTLTEFMRHRREEHSDAVHLFSGRTFQSSRSGTAFVGGICSAGRAGGVNEVGDAGVGWVVGTGPHGDNVVPIGDPIMPMLSPLQYGSMAAMAVTLAQTLGQNVGMMWNKHRTSAGDCRCPDVWLGCIMEDTGYYLPRKFSRCSIDEYNQFLQDGGGSCLFNKPLKLLDPPECGNGFVEAGEECDCGSQTECARSGGNCCKKCTLTHDAMCSDGLCCRGCKVLWGTVWGAGSSVGSGLDVGFIPQYEPRGVSCREAVNECDIPETCTGDSSQVRGVIGALWGQEGTEGPRGHSGAMGVTAGVPPTSTNWTGTSVIMIRDVLCGFLLCANVSGSPRLGELSGEVATTTFFHQNRYVDCRGGHVQLADGSELSYVEDGTPCGPAMLCLDHKCLPVTAFNFSSCPGSRDEKICFGHGVCSNEGKCICQPEWTGKDCSVYDPIPEPKPTGETERYKGPSGTNIIIGSIAGAVLVAAIVLGGTGWGFK